MPGLHHDWGLAPYADLHALQQRLVELRVEGLLPDTLLTGEHPAVITLGRKTPRDERIAGPIPVVAVERGGEATYHGPGQLVAYPIISLVHAHRDLHAFQRDLEEVGLRTLASLGLSGQRIEGLTGVWCQGKKLMSLGIAVRRWVTWHGLALNVCNDLTPFRAFHPCGLDGEVMGSVSSLLGRPVSVAEARAHLLEHANAVLPGGPFVAGPLPAAALPPLPPA